MAGSEPLVAARTCHPGWGGALRRTALATLGCLGCTAPALAENWRTTATASVRETYTNNVDYTSQGANTSDFATSLAAGLIVRGEGARVQLNGSLAASWQLYARESHNNSIAPRVNLLGRVEAIENVAFVEAEASVAQTFATPFGPQPADLVNATNNRYTSQTYRISPYIQGRVPGTSVTYQLRDDNIWTIASQFGDSSVRDLPNTYLNELKGSVSSAGTPAGWTGEFERTHYAPSGGDAVGSYTIAVARGIGTYKVDPQLQVSLRAGYEKDRFPLSGSQNVIYGAGGQWNPTDRTKISGFWEHRFFGSSYSLDASHRLPRVSMSAKFARQLNTYPQSALTIPAGADVAAFVDAAFTTRIPDPAERALAVQQFLAQSALPPTLATPVNVFSAQVQLQTTGNVTAVLLGARHSIALNAFYLKSVAISGEGSPLPPALQFGQDSTQSGGGASYSHRITSHTNLTASATYSRTEGNRNDGALADLGSRNVYFNVGATTTFGARTSANAGVSYSRYRPEDGIDSAGTSAWNAFVGLNYRF
jgi:uncharacterized protein (PEP-CTERM system associated)